MIESPDFADPVHGIPVFSLYGDGAAADRGDDGRFDVLLVDLQDVGCRIYTFVTTLRYVLEEAAQHAQGGVGARSAEPGRPSGRRACACAPAGRASSAPARCRCATA